MRQATQYSIDQIKELAAITSQWRGWDLLQLKTRRAPVPWRLQDAAAEVLAGRESVLDMGSGDGRVLASLADSFMRGIGVDVSKTRVDRARLSLPMKLRMRVHFTRASAHAVPAPDATFQMVLNRHAPLFPEEIDRVLIPGGVFLTQQIGEQNARAITGAFDEARGTAVGSRAGLQENQLPRTFEVLSSSGYEVLKHEQYDVPFVFGDAASLLFWMQAVPVPHDFDIERDAETVLEILDHIATPNGIVTNEHRELLVMRKPE